MNVVRCERGHYYDKALGNCPVCTAEAAANAGKPDLYGPTVPEIEISNDDLPIFPAGYPVLDLDTDTEELEPLAGAVEMVDPDLRELPERMVAGWLVCVAGPEKGKSFCLYTGSNTIGRSEEMDVRLTADTAVSRERHASITYDLREKRFFAMRGETRNITYVNGKALRREVELNSRDILEIGKCMMMFVPFCGAEFDWRDTDRFCQP